MLCSTVARVKSCFERNHTLTVSSLPTNTKISKQAYAVSRSFHIPQLQKTTLLPIALRAHFLHERTMPKRLQSCMQAKGPQQREPSPRRLVSIEARRRTGNHTQWERLLIFAVI